MSILSVDKAGYVSNADGRIIACIRGDAQKPGKTRWVAPRKKHVRTRVMLFFGKKRKAFILNVPPMVQKNKVNPDVLLALELQEEFS